MVTYLSILKRQRAKEQIMKYTVKKEKSEVTLEFKADAAEWKEAESKAYSQTKGKYAVPGFRKGHAPKHVIEQYYGAGVFADDAMDIIIQSGWDKFLDENEKKGEEALVPVDRPSANIVSMDDKGVKFTLQFPVTPEVNLGEYKGIKIPKIEYNVSEEDVDAELKRIAERGAKIEEKDGAAENGDIVNLDYSGSVDGVKFDGGTAEKYNLTLGSNTFIPGFEDQLVGVKKGDEKEVKVTFPEQYHAENLAGKEAVFACKVNSVSAKVVPEMNDEWAKDVSEFDNLAAYRDSVRKRLQEANDRRAKTEKENAVINAVVDASSADIPEAMVQSYISDMLRDLEMRLYYQGMRLEDYFKYMGTTEEDYRKENHDKAVRGALTRLCLEEMIKREKIEATDEEAEKKYMDSMPEPEDGKEKRKPDERELSYLKNEIVMDKLLDMLVSSAVTEG